MAIYAGAPCNDYNGTTNGHARLFTFSSTMNTWNCICNALFGEASFDNLGRSASTCSDGETVTVGAPYNNDNGDDGGRVKILRYKI